MTDINVWMQNNHLQLNASKTEIIFFGKAQELWSSDWWPPNLGPCPSPKLVARNLGVKSDKLSMKDHDNHVTCICYGLMQSLRKFFQWIPVESRKPLVHGLVISRPDYGNTLMASINEELLTKLQVLQNTAARLVLNLPSRSPSAPSLGALHWLPIRKRISFKINCSVQKTMHGNGPRYLAQKLMWYLPSRTLRSATKHLLTPLKICTTRNGGRSFSYLAPTL